MSYSEEIRGNNEWNTYNLDEVYDFSSGLSKSSKEFGFGYPFVTFKDVFYNYFIPQELTELANTTEKERIRCSVMRGDVFLTRTSETIDELGKSSVAIKDYPQATFNGFTKRLRPNGKIQVYPEYVGYYFRSPKFRSEINSMATMTTRASLNNDMMARLKIVLPSMEEQKAISEILLSLDKKIELNKDMNKTLEEMAKALFKRWFVDFEFPNEYGEPYKSSGGEMVESELGMIPKGWNCSKLEKVMRILTQNEKPFENPEKVYEHFSIPAYDSSLLPKFEEGNSISSNKYKVDNDCILISKLNPSTKRLWNPFCVTDDSICSTEFIVFKPEDISFKAFFYELINTDKFYEYMVSHATGSTGSRQRIKPKETLAFEFVMPPNQIVEKVCNVIQPLHEKSQRLLQENKELENLRDSLLPKLMSGEIRVEDIEANL